MASASTHTENELIAILKKGDINSMNILYQNYYGMVRHHVIHNDGSEEDAELVFQETVYILYCNVKKPDFQLKSKLKIVVSSIARNIWFNMLKTKGISHPKIKSFEPHIKVDMGSFSELLFAEKPEFSKVQKSFKILGESCQKLLTLYYFQHKSIEEITLILNATPEEVKTQKHRCIQNLKRMLK